MVGIFAIAIDNNQNMIIIEDLINLHSSVYSYHNDELECIPDIWNISSSEDDEHPWAEPLNADEINFYLDEIDFNSVNSFTAFSSYLREKAKV